MRNVSKTDYLSAEETQCLTSLCCVKVERKSWKQSFMLLRQTREYDCTYRRKSWTNEDIHRTAKKKKKKEHFTLQGANFSNLFSQPN